jgi:hypothetical protein
MMKYVIVAEPRIAGSPQENMRSMKNLHEVFGKWEAPEGINFSSFNERIDGQGAFIVFECDDPVLVTQVCTQWNPWVRSAIHPVVDVEDQMGAEQKAIDWHDSLSL